MHVAHDRPPLPSAHHLDRLHVFPGAQAQRPRSPAPAAGCQETSTASSTISSSSVGLKIWAMRTQTNRKTTAFFAEFQPNSWYEKRLVSRLAFTSVQLDRSAELTISDLRRVIDRAENYWDIDRRGEVDELGKRLKNDPERVARRLERSTQGADWLIERWEGLAEAVMTHGCWDERQRDLAFDLLGISKILRDGHVRVPRRTIAPGWNGWPKARSIGSGNSSGPRSTGSTPRNRTWPVAACRPARTPRRSGCGNMSRTSSENGSGQILSCSSSVRTGRSRRTPARRIARDPFPRRRHAHSSTRCRACRRQARTSRRCRSRRGP